ncbi:glycosyltransferase [Algibacter amylolyticus]|uniref:Glycosyltransferase n=1 Tax=Algibacter amylolyticus TaxID=1608400 RepID=A0A5M7B2J7_9FLAO|nr:glycosyltransferase [Algibacter amylolyticus]KAA5822427.1 glycosyltransferase [Algibacter amylolyticus]MBB5269149.1 glycosyltransferase involved in cell wall biosynthesis [Algibacter amylolyticus]TSJ73577.1 glycosyltransferase [Algibacter amylolyticus]
MKFLIITHVEHKLNGRCISAYAPYVREMNIWLKHVDDVVIVAPKTSDAIGSIDLEYKHNSIQFNKIEHIQFTSVLNMLSSLFKMPLILISIYKQIKKADHIHLRCPGNIGLLACIVQIFFPKKIKTAKYAGNWDPKAKQPSSYRFQKWILSNTFLTKNMSVLVYGQWENQTKNIKPFFTASYFDSEKVKPEIRSYTEILKFAYVGGLVSGKRPLLAIKIIENLHKTGNNVRLDMYGEGERKGELKEYISKNKLEGFVKLQGNKEKQIIKEAFHKTHFLILPSKSEGWPKAVAEAMFFGSIPISMSISCIPFMLDYGKRGLLIEPNVEMAANKIVSFLNKEGELQEMSKLASNWSQKYTLDVFETEIAKLLG